jgi:hypothetical protein
LEEKCFQDYKKIAYAAALSAGLSLLIPSGAIAQDQDHHDQQSQDQDHHGQQSQDQDHHGQQLQDQHRDWSNNSNYQMGAREGSKDHKSNQRKTHNHKFDNDDDRRAYQAGYDSAWQGNQNSGHDEDRPH